MAATLIITPSPHATSPAGRAEQNVGDDDDDGDWELAKSGAVQDEVAINARTPLPLGAISLRFLTRCSSADLLPSC